MGTVNWSHPLSESKIASIVCERNVRQHQQNCEEVTYIDLTQKIVGDKNYNKYTTSTNVLESTKSTNVKVY